MSAELLTGAELADEDLWRMSREGNREAFGRIVARYQALICSLAYSGCGSLQESEDLSQEVFVSAWKRLGELREPAKLRQWLCGIARHRIADVVRREVRRGGRPASLDVMEEKAAELSDPADQAVSREEEALLWRALGRMPENYREPMILFYREQQSVAEVAEQLELTEDTVKQRLSRGRAMLREEITSVVETTLSRSKPGSAFTIGVLVALPVAGSTTASAAVLAATNSAAGAAGKGILAKLGAGAVLGPMVGLTIAYLGTKASASTARTEKERNRILHYARWRIIPFCFLMSIGLAVVLGQAGKMYEASAAGIIGGVTAWVLALIGGILWFCRKLDREVLLIRRETGTTDEEYERLRVQRGEIRSLPRRFESKARLLGLPLFAMGWGDSDSVEARRGRAVIAWIALGDVAMSPFVAFGGMAVAPIAMGAISVGVFSVSVFWGIAVGVVAIGSLACGWWALGFASVGWKCAVGCAALAREYAVGLVTQASHTGAAAKMWLREELVTDLSAVFVQQWYWWVLICFASAMGLRLDRREAR